MKKNIAIQDATWKGRNVLIITLSVIIASLLFYAFTLVLFGDKKWNFLCSRYVASLLMISLPVIWLKRHGLSKEAIGLTKHNSNVLKFTIIGVVAAIFYTCLYYLVFLKAGSSTAIIGKDYSYVDLILLPLSISGFASIVLVPISEEIMVRGFVYGYLRTKLGVLFGLILQSLLFAILHYNIFRGAWSAVGQTFIVGLILGFLYEKSGSLYPAMISHGVINYLGIIAILFKK